LTTVHLVDGTYELFRAYFGAPEATGPLGNEVGATRALLRSLTTLLREAEVTHIACAFDTVIESFRNDLFAGYKTGAGIDPDLWSQFPLAERASEALGIRTFRMIEFEADDALATSARGLESDPDVTRVVICSPDKDLAQCVRADRVICLDRLRQKRLDEAGVVEKFGVPPASIPDLLALVGDTADGIPGVPRWGLRSAAALLARYGSIEAIPRYAKDWDVSVRGAAALAESLAEHREAVALYKRLATLRTDVPIDTSLGAFEWHGASRPLLEPLCTEIGESAVLSRIPRWAC
jgi:5'-3' exonuclease